MPECSQKPNMADSLLALRMRTKTTEINREEGEKGESGLGLGVSC